MTDNHEELKRRLAETRAQMERLEAELEQAEQWEPEGGEFLVTLTGSVHPGSSIFKEQETFGLRYPTRAQAERARDLMRAHNRALAYVQEHAPDWDGSDPWCMYKWGSGWSVYQPTPPDLGTICGPHDVMKQLAEDLNSGRVKL